jgi:hypothetical protein
MTASTLPHSRPQAHLPWTWRFVLLACALLGLASLAPTSPERPYPSHIAQ